MNILLRHYLLLMFVRKSWLIVLLCIGILPFVFATFTPLEDSPNIEAPARAQAAWALLGICTFFWAIFQSADLGANLSRNGLGEYLKSRGIGSIRQLSALSLTALSILIPMVLCCSLVSIFGAMPSKEAEHSMWIWTNLQFSLFFILAAWPLSTFAAGIASRFGMTIGFLLPTLLGWIGIYGVRYLQEMNNSNPNTVLEALIAVIPHYYFADPINRLIFKLGNLASGDVWAISLYFASFGIILFGLSLALFKPVK